MGHVRHFRPSLAALFVGAFGLLSAACASSSGGGGGTGGDGPDSNGCFDYSGFNEKTPTVQFQKDVLPIFRKSCGLSMSCHGGEVPETPGQHFLGPSISDPNPDAMQITEILGGIVGAKSADEPEMDVVAPGDPAHSFLLFKLDGDPNNLNGLTCPTLKCASNMSCLLAMPSGGPSLPEGDRDAIRRWIAQGAKND